MPTGLKRYQTLGHNHAINFCCYDHRPYLDTPESRSLVERSLEQTRLKYAFEVYAYVIMPDHLHLLTSEPRVEPLSKAIQAFKVSVSKQLPQRPFWQDRYYDFNLFNQSTLVEKLTYIHENPVRAGLVETPEHWPHSSSLTYLTKEQRTVHITGI